MFIKFCEADNIISKDLFNTCCGKNINDILDDLLLVVQNIFSGIATVSKNLLNDNRLEYKIQLSTNHPEIIIHYQLCSKHRLVKDINPVLEYQNVRTSEEIDDKSKYCESQFSLKDVERMSPCLELSSIVCETQVNINGSSQRESHHFEYEPGSRRNSVSDDWSSTLEISRNETIIKKENPEFLDLCCSDSENEEEEQLKGKKRFSPCFKLRENTGTVNLLETHACADSNGVSNVRIDNCVLNKREFDEIPVLSLVSAATSSDDVEPNQNGETLKWAKDFENNNEDDESCYVGNLCETSLTLVHAKTSQHSASFKCSYCDSRFNHPSSRHRHEKIHTQKRAYECNKSSTSTSINSNQLERNSLVVGPYKCNYCESYFLHASSKHRHEKMHTGESPYFCSYCDKFFTQKSNRNKHERIHTGEKPFTCRFCKKPFSCTSSRNKHEKSHSH